MEWNEFLNPPAEGEEILEEMKKVKDSSPGEDKVRMNFINWSDDAVWQVVVETVKFMFIQGGGHSLKVGLLFPIHKKGPRNDTVKYRGVVLLAMGNRLLARIIAYWLRAWEKGMEIPLSIGPLSHAQTSTTAAGPALEGGQVPAF